jgi:hypothetical protein
VDKNIDKILNVCYNYELVSTLNSKQKKEIRNEEEQNSKNEGRNEESAESNRIERAD